ncbi:serine protease inhibitor 3/4-like [Ostrinia furnacalis]|uniref:serine protease inhibitor 3/4-like n=1 Tax=Ostrinia furnacalis TaxID=93504 RepID=UPI001040776B|nr:serine protease inhibitor 3/4-like [Ostrinia furnacalis]
MDLLKTIRSETYWMQLDECEVLKVSPVSTVVSPFALSLPLCQLASVAKGHAKEELMSALGIPRESEIKNYYINVYRELLVFLSSTLMLKNMIYLNDSLEVDRAVMNASSYYGVRIDKVGFRYPKAAAKFMNHWFAQETLYRVATLIDEEDIDNTTSMVILNGIYFKVAWDQPFDGQFTRPQKFYDLSNKIWMIPMFSIIDSLKFLDDVNNHVKIVNLNLMAPGATITFFLPENRAGLPDLINKFSNNPYLLKKMMSELRIKTMPMRLYLPRMKIKTYVDWTGFIRLIGVNDIFSVNDSGLEGMLEKDSKGKVYLSKAKQKVFLEMDETGMTWFQNPVNTDKERAAREFAEFGDNLEQVVFDHPFLFVVQLAGKGEPHHLLTGAFYGPEEEE